MSEPYDHLETVESGVGRLLARNPSAFTFTGTNSFIVGVDEVAVIDPGPDQPEHVAALVKAIAGRPVKGILCTHTHRDHSPAARPLAEATGAPIIGCAPLAPKRVDAGADAAFDRDYVADRVLAHGDSIQVDGEAISAVATPGHTSNHLCFAYRDILFSGDHVMGWSTTVVIPPDGHMGDYMASLEKLRQRDDRLYLPAHGPAVTRPKQYLRGLIGHRLQREKQILRLLGERSRDVPSIVAAAYPGLDPRLTGAAGASVHAHLLDLQERGLVRLNGETWILIP